MVDVGSVFRLGVVWDEASDCGLWWVLKEVMVVQFLGMGVLYRLWCVWLERCRDCSYVLHKCIAL